MTAEYFIGLIAGILIGFIVGVITMAFAATNDIHKLEDELEMYRNRTKKKNIKDRNEF